MPVVVGAASRLMSDVRVGARAGGGLVIEAVLRRPPGPVLHDEEATKWRKA